MSDRIATALERIADALEGAHPKFNPGGYVGGDYTIPEPPLRGHGRVVTRDAIRAALDAKPCDDRTCTDRDHWAPRGRCDPAVVQRGPGASDCDNHRDTGLSAAWDACEVADEYLDGSGAARPKLIVSTAPDPLDEDDHRPRHDTEGDHWTWRRADRWCSRKCPCGGVWTMPEIVEQYGSLTFCDCPDDDDPTDSDRATD